LFIPSPIFYPKNTPFTGKNNFTASLLKRFSSTKPFLGYKNPSDIRKFGEKSTDFPQTSDLYLQYAEFDEKTTKPTNLRTQKEISIQSEADSQSKTCKIQAFVDHHVH